MMMSKRINLLFEALNLRSKIPLLTFGLSEMIPTLNIIPKSKTHLVIKITSQMVITNNEHYNKKRTYK